MQQGGVLSVSITPYIPNPACPASDSSRLGSQISPRSATPSPEGRRRVKKSPSPKLKSSRYPSPASPSSDYAHVKSRVFDGLGLPSPEMSPLSSQLAKKSPPPQKRKTRESPLFQFPEGQEDLSPWGESDAKSPRRHITHEVAFPRSPRHGAVRSRPPSYIQAPLNLNPRTHRVSITLWHYTCLHLKSHRKTLITLNYTQLHSITLNYTQLHSITLNYTVIKSFLVLGLFQWN